ncbi:biotin-dependent carboxyltransferase family protein [Paenibacillus sp. y28]|uniref:5-oxoprolinase subunit C family protein n=1 Tax=Paenibacillus sp. y28 TaxID=3129110 RepID=UPI0030191058
MTIEVLRPGMFTTVQDLGRTGYQRYGVTSGGAVDRLSLRMANLIAGNPLHAPGLEMTMTGGTFLFRRRARIALCGAFMPAFIGDVLLPMWRPVWVNSGSTLRIGPAAAGLRTYLAVAGGIAVPPVLGGAGTDIRAGFGGCSGRALRAGDVLAVGRDGLAEGFPEDAAIGRLTEAEMDAATVYGAGEGRGGGSGISRLDEEKEDAAQAGNLQKRPMWPHWSARPWNGGHPQLELREQSVSPFHAAVFAAVGGIGHALAEGAPVSPIGPRVNRQNSGSPVVVRFVRGREYDWFTPQSRELLTGAVFTMSPLSDRMGCRLSGPGLTLLEPRELLSEGVTPGTVQVPARGDPIVLMADRQPTGGYPRIAQIISVDMPLLGQLRPGDQLRLQEVSLAEAQQELLLQELGLRQLSAGLQLQARLCGGGLS